MKKVIILGSILFLICISFSLPVLAKDGGYYESGDKCDKEGKCLPYKQNEYPQGLICHPKLDQCYEIEDAGEKGEGDVCTKDIECGGYNQLCSQLTWKCSYPKPYEGQSCNRNKECHSNLFCDLGTKQCAEKGEQGSSCSGIGECEEGFECDKESNTCLKYGVGIDEDGSAYKQGLVEPGGDCLLTKECTSGYYCPTTQGSEKGECEPKLSDGNSPCSKNEMCQSGNCDAGTCIATQARGGDCDPDDPKKQCDETKDQCVEGKCIIMEGGAPETYESEQSRRIGASFNLNCNKDVEKGLFQKGVSNKCFNCGNCSARDIMVIIANVTTGTFEITGLFGVFAVFVAGFMYLISRGKEEETKKAKAALSAAIIGVVIIVTAWLLINTIMNVLGYNCGTWWAPNFVC